MISIIVPVYKTEKYLPACVESVLGQTYKDFELILVDDGSPDESPALCDGYASRDSRVRVIHQANAGLSGARNSGIEASRGEWLLFLDSDDCVDVNMLARLVEIQARTGADIVSCGFASFLDGTEPVSQSADGAEREYTAHGAVADMFDGNGIGWNAWGKLYRKELFASLRYPVGVLCEDKAVTYKAYLNAKKIVHTQSKLCFYRVRESSIMGTRSKRLCLDSLRINEEICRNLGEVDATLYALACGYAAKCAFFYYTVAYGKEEMTDVARLCVEQMRKYHSYTAKCGYMPAYQRISLNIVGKSLRKKDNSFSLRILTGLSGLLKRGRLK